MGGSDPWLFPQYERYILDNLAREFREAKKVAWLGLQSPYRVSRFAESINKNLESHYYDIAAVEDDKFCHVFDLNEEGYGEKLRKENFDIMTVLRCSCYMNDHKKSIKEFKDFLTTETKTIWFEDLDPNPDTGEEVAYYKGIRTVKTKKPFTKSVLEANFCVRGYTRIFGPDGRWYDQYVLTKNKT